MNFMITVSENDDQIIITPTERKNKFPAFDDVEVTPEGHVHGWAGDKPSNMEHFYFGRLGNVECVSQSKNKMIFKKK